MFDSQVVLAKVNEVHRRISLSSMFASYHVRNEVFLCIELANDVQVFATMIRVHTNRDYLENNNISLSSSSLLFKDLSADFLAIVSLLFDPFE
jgi:hypothetical protein